MSDAAPTLLYLEPDDEITVVARRVADADAERVVLVAPGRSRATSSAVGLRLLARLAADRGVELAVVAEAVTRSLASEAGLVTYASVDDALRANPVIPDAPRRAAIHVVRGDEPTLPRVELPAPPAESRAVPRSVVDDTRPMPVAPVVRPRAERRSPEDARAAGRRAAPIALIAALVLGVVLAAGAVAVILPSASIEISPASAAIVPRTYQLSFEDPQVVSGTAEVTQPGTAGGAYHDLVAAAGDVTFRNFNVAPVEVPAGTRVAAGEITFVTTAAVLVPPGTLTGQGTIRGGEAAAPAVAEVAGPGGNVPAEAIDTVLDEDVAAALRAFANNGARLVVNYDAMAGGVDQAGPVIEQADLDAAIGALRAALDAEVADALESDADLVTAVPAEPVEPEIRVPEGLLGARDQETFEIGGELAYRQLGVPRSDVVSEATNRLATDDRAAPDGHEILPSTIQVAIGSVSEEAQTLLVEVVVTARSAARIDTTAVAERVAGLPIPDARQALAELGTSRIDTWPAWVDAVPRLAWRIDVRVDAPVVPDVVPSQSLPPGSGSP